MKRLLLVFAVLWYGVALSGATTAPELGGRRHQNHWFSTHYAKTDFGKYFFPKEDERSTAKLSRTALALGIFSTLFVAAGYLVVFSSLSILSILFFVAGIAMGIGALIHSKKVFRRNDSGYKDNRRATFGLIGGILGLTMMLPLLLLFALEED